MSTGFDRSLDKISDKLFTDWENHMAPVEEPQEVNPVELIYAGLMVVADRIEALTLAVLLTADIDEERIELAERLEETRRQAVRARIAAEAGNG